MSQSIKEFTSEILRTIEEDLLNDIELESIYNRLYENQKISLENINRYYFLNIIIMTSYILIQNDILQSINIFDLNIKNKTFILFTIPVLAALLNYIIISHLTNYIIIDDALRCVELKKYPKLHKNLLEILSLPTFLESLNFKYKLNLSFKAEIKFVAISIIIVLTPFILLLYAQCCLIFEYYNDLRIIIILISIFISYRFCTNLFNLLKSVK